MEALRQIKDARDQWKERVRETFQAVKKKYGRYEKADAVSYAKSQGLTLKEAGIIYKEVFEPDIAKNEAVSEAARQISRPSSLGNRKAILDDLWDKAIKSVTE